VTLRVQHDKRTRTTVGLLTLVRHGESHALTEADVPADAVDRAALVSAHAPTVTH
jgi:hypothetical protein